MINNFIRRNIKNKKKKIPEAVFGLIVGGGLCLLVKLTQTKFYKQLLLIILNTAVLGV